MSHGAVVHRSIAERRTAARLGFCDGCGRPLPGRSPAADVTVDTRRVERLASAASKLAAGLAERVEDGPFALWLAPCVLAASSGGELVVVAPVETATWVRERFGAVLAATTSALAGREMRVKVVAGDVSACAAWTFGALSESFRDQAKLERGDAV